MNQNHLLQFLLTLQVIFPIREEKCLTNCIWGFIKFAIFEEQIKMFDENKQQLDLPFSATQRLEESLINPYSSVTLGTDASCRPH